MRMNLMVEVTKEHRIAMAEALGVKPPLDRVSAKDELYRLVEGYLSNLVPLKTDDPRKEGEP